MEPVYIALICVGAAALVGLIALFVYLSNNLIGVTRYTLESEKIRKGGVKIVHLTDLHGKSFGKDNRKLIKKVAAQSPDFIVITGDIIHKYRDKDALVALKAVASLKEVAPVFYVSGNHEMRSKHYRELRARLIEAGACVLDDCTAHICGLNLYGVNCASIKSGKYFNFLKGGEDGFNLLLAHLPQYIDRYASAGFDGALCGHAHGGQWRIPFTGIGFYSPGQGLFPKYTSGVHISGNMSEVISRGLGNSECPLRLFNRPEIVVVELKNPADRK